MKTKEKENLLLRLSVLTFVRLSQVRGFSLIMTATESFLNLRDLFKSPVTFSLNVISFRVLISLSLGEIDVFDMI